MKHKSIGIVSAVIAGILIWPVVLITREKPRPLIPTSEVVAEETRRQTEDVSVEINYLAGKSGENKLVFEISLNTHSIDLNDIDFQKSVVMQRGGQIFAPSKVENSGSSHHRSAMLSFPRVGVPLKIVFAGTQEIERQEFGFENLP